MLCKGCDEDRPEDAFPRGRKTCQRCRTQASAAYRKTLRGRASDAAYRENNRGLLREQYRRTREKNGRKAYMKHYLKAAIQRNKAFVRSLKDVPCADCGGRFPYFVMDFDHLTDKKFAIARRVNTATSLECLKAEIAKCQVVCANCHRIRTYGRGDHDPREVV